MIVYSPVIQVGGIEDIVIYDIDTDGPSEEVKESKREEDVDVHEKWWMESLDRLGKIRKRAVVKQDKARTEMKMFSQPPGVDINSLKSYTYDDSAGADITVYVLDTGYNTKNPVSSIFFRRWSSVHLHSAVYRNIPAWRENRAGFSEDHRHGKRSKRTSTSVVMVVAPHPRSTDPSTESPNKSTLSL